MAEQATRLEAAHARASQVNQNSQLCILVLLSFDRCAFPFRSLSILLAEGHIRDLCWNLAKIEPERGKKCKVSQDAVQSRTAS